MITPRLHRPRTWPGSTAQRSGFALIVTLSFMVILMALMVAAQNAVMTSTRLIKRSDQRIDREEITTGLLDQALVALKANPAVKKGRLKAVKTRDQQATARTTWHKIGAKAPVYDKLAGIGFRRGDALVIIRWIGGAEMPPEYYLINTEGRRRGAIPAPPNR